MLRPLYPNSPAEQKYYDVPSAPAYAGKHGGTVFLKTEGIPQIRAELLS